MEPIREITYRFPERTEAEIIWNQRFLQLMKGIRAVDGRPHGVTLLPAPEGALPVTTIVLDEDISLPEVSLGNGIRPLELIEGRPLGSMLEAESGALRSSGLESASERFPLGRLVTALQGRVIAVDHTGVNLPSVALRSDAWRGLLGDIANAANLYRYPGEEWPFLFPATTEEFLDDIRAFDVYRTMKFELVYDTCSTVPIIQFALVTDMSRDEAERIFSDAGCFGIPGLEEVFRSVLVASPWDDQLLFRMDLYYKRNSEGLNDWESGRWLVTEGGRIR